jgi:hypothetical protein
MHGLQCPKLLWCDYNAKHLFPDVSPAKQAVFDQGHEVGSLAKKMFPDGVEIDCDPADFERAIELTKHSISSRVTIFEAAFSANGEFARADILNPVGNAWDMIEVKSTTRVKDEHIPDLAFQVWVFTGAGIKISRCFLCHINNQFVKHGGIDPNELFTLRDVTAEVAKFSHSIEEHISGMGKIIRAGKCPEIQIGRHCDSPYTCQLHDHCWKFLPPQNVTELYDDKKGRRWDLLAKKILRLVEIPNDYSLAAKQQIQRATAISGQPHIKRPQIEAFLKNLKFPLHFLDFETFSTAIPLLDGTKPYQQIPFQFSLHIVHKQGEKPEHRKFMAEGKDEPRPEFMRQLKSAIEPCGSIVVFNASFEKTRLKECAEILPQHGKWVATVNGRIVDLLNPFKAFNFYHPNQNGSASMKAVLPALTGKGYGHLEIQEGGAAGREFVRVTFGDVNKLERKRVRQALDEYCGQDTEGMVWILDALRLAIYI